MTDEAIANGQDWTGGLEWLPGALDVPSNAFPTAPPWRAEHEGLAYVVHTDRCGAIVLRAASNFPSPLKTSPLFERPADRARLDRPALLTWLATIAEPLTPETPCPDCEGRKLAECETCYGTGTHSCSGCSDSHDCGECEGKGEVPCDCAFARALSISGGIVPVRLAGATFDARRMLAMARIPGAGGIVAVRRGSDKEAAVMFDGDGWRYALKPCRNQDGRPVHKIPGACHAR